MPSTMIHLLFANKIHSDYPVEYYIGTIAPDAIAVRENYIFTDKDKLHFRNSNNPLDAIADFAKTLDMTNPYCEGYIVHLYLDAYWDKDCLEPFKNNYTSYVWVSKYREEISKAAAYLYHTSPTLKDIWTQMIAYNKHIDLDIQGIKHDEIVSYYTRNAYWFEKYNTGQSKSFTNKFVYTYVDKIVEKYLVWIKTIM